MFSQWIDVLGRENYYSLPLFLGLEE